MGPIRRSSMAWLVALFMVVSVACAPSGPEEEATGEPTSGSPAPADAAEPHLTYPGEDLEAGRITTGAGSETVVTFEVPEGWWGEQSSGTAWVLGLGSAARPARSEVTLWVETLTYSFREALSIYNEVDGLEPGTPTKMRVDGRRAVMFATEVEGNEHVPLEDLGTGGDIRWDLETRQVFIDAGPTAMLIRVEVPGGRSFLDDGLKVLRTFTFADA